MDICGRHGPEMAYENESCPACQKINELELKIIVLQSELADYGRTVTRLNKEIKKVKLYGYERYTGSKMNR